VEGFLRGFDYIARRNKLIEALRIPTNDDNPGYIDLPFWGRFPVVVGDNYEVSENTEEQGQCAVSIPFIRAGVSITDRVEALPPAEVQFENAAVNLEAAAIDDFEKKLPNSRLDITTLRAGFGQIKSSLLGIIGRIQGARTVLDAMTAEVIGIINLINQGIRAPGELAKAFFNAGTSIVGGILEIKNSIAMYGRKINRGSSNSGNGLEPGGSNGSGESGSGGSSGNDGSSGNGNSSGDGGSGLGTGGPNGSGESGSGGSFGAGFTSTAPELPPPDNEKNALVPFLSASAYTLPIEAATVSQEATKAAIENLYRTMAFLAAARIIANMDSLTYKKTEGYWRLVKKLEESIDRENPVVYAAVRDVSVALSRELSGRELSAELIRNVSSAAPLLYLAYHLGCDEEKIRELNSVADSFVVEGEVIYV
jgi:hypothetical protein